MNPEQQFHFRDGTSIASLDALKEKIETISYNDFYHHVNQSRNDFANWIRYVLKDENLADQLDKTTSIVETVEVINDYLHPRKSSREDDIQTRIEEKLGIEFDNKKEEELGELPELPETTTNEETELPVIDEEREENQEQIITEREDDQLQDQNEQPDNNEQLDSNEQQDNKQADNKQEITAEEPYSHHYKHSMREKNELKEFHHNLDKIIVKDFIWGIIFGLILGFILARMLSL